MARGKSITISYLTVLMVAALAFTSCANGVSEGNGSQPKYAYIDRTGKVVMELHACRLSPTHIHDFSEGLAVVYIEGKMGYINNSGDIVIDPRFEWADRFSEGLAPAKIDGEFGYIDMSGTFVIEPRFEEAYPFSDGLARVMDEDGKYGYIDHSGEYAIEPKFDMARDFSEGLARAGTGPRSVETPRGFINSDGEYVIPPELEGIDTSGDGADFFEGKALFAQKEWTGDYLVDIKCGFIDKAGTIVIEPMYAYADHFSEGLAAVQIDGKWGYIDSAGNIIIEPQFDNAGTFSEGLASVKLEDKWGYIDRNGNVVIEPQFEEAGDFSQGLAPVEY